MLLKISVFLRSFAVMCTVVTVSSYKRQTSYRGYSLVRIMPRTQHQLQYLLKLTAQTGGGVQIWYQTSAIGHPADVMLSPSAAKRVFEKLDSLGMTYELLIPDIQKTIEDDLTAVVKTAPYYEFYRNYQNIDKISQYIRNLAKQNHRYVSILEIGTSFEGRRMEVLRINTDTDLWKPAIWIQGGASAREQIGPATVIFIAEELITSFYVDYDDVQLVKGFDWYFLPVLNPDGYNFCQSKDRLWSKTRSRKPNSKHCIGVDANRNWNIHWNGTGSSSNPCSITYSGSEPFSEPETKAVSEFMKVNLRDRLELFVDFHSYSQKWGTPWGYTSELPTTYEEQKRLAEVATAALKTVNGTQYSVGSSGNIMYTISGGAMDWVYKFMKARYSYVVELRDKRQFGFLLPRNQILPTAIETSKGIRAMVLEIIKKFPS